ncbi:MAG: YihY/virulence factor BrkB family protein [Gemmatimonadota bacterium]
MFELSKATFRNFMRDECPRMAAALSYYTVISLPALLGLVLKRLLSFGMILVIAFLLLVSMVLSALLSAAGGLVAARLPGEVGAVALWVMELGLSLLVITGLFTAIYKILPDAHVSWSDVWRGALVTAALFVAGKSLLGVYISRSDPGSAYGAAGSLAVVLIWIYYSSMIALLGAEFTQAYAVRRGSGIEPDGDAVAADV